MFLELLIILVLLVFLYHIRHTVRLYFENEIHSPLSSIYNPLIMMSVMGLIGELLLLLLLSGVWVKYG